MAEGASTVVPVAQESEVAVHRFLGWGWTFLTGRHPDKNSCENQSDHRGAPCHNEEASVITIINLHALRYGIYERADTHGKANKYSY
jgi:hypothetical protein